MIVAPLFRARLPIVVDKVLCTSTPGSTVDVLVTQRGVAVNPQRKELKDMLKAGGLPVYEIEELKQLAENYTGAPKPSRPFGRTVAEVEYRDFSIIDRIGCVER